METNLRTPILVLAAFFILVMVPTSRALGQEACPVSGTPEQRTSFLETNMGAMRVKSDAAKAQQQEWMTQIRAELKLAGKWSAKIGKAWNKEIESDPAFQAHQKNIERLLKDSDALLLTALSDPYLPCNKIEMFLSIFAEVQVETNRQFEIMNKAMLARRELPSSDR
jgi:hypothetical protein